MKRKTGDMKHAGSMKEELGKEDEPKVQKIIGKLKKASDAHAGQAKDLEKAMKEEITDAERMAKMRVSQMRLQTKLRDLDVGNPNDKTKIAITKNDLENIQMKMDQLKNKRERKEHPAKALYEKIASYKRKQKKQVCLTQYLNKYITEEWMHGKVIIDQYYTSTMGNGSSK